MLLKNYSNPLQDVRAAEQRPGGSFEILQALKILFSSDYKLTIGQLEQG